jgi:Predicted hydrolases or acyltransferases (alpha/beta hydrolase superfamily)
METGNYTTVNGIKLYYERSGSGTPVIFLHTAGTDGRVWKEFVSLLPEGITAIVPDLPGHGKSWPWKQWRKKRVDVRFYSLSILEMMDQIGIDRAILVGCSIGADIVLDICSIHPERVIRALVMEGAARTETFEVETIMKTETGNVERAFDFCGSLSHKNSIENLIWIRSSNNRDIYINDLLAWNSFDISHDIDGCKTEIYLLRGSEDPVVTEDMLIATSKYLPNSHMITMEGLGHYPMLERPDLCLKNIQGLLEKQA